MTHLPPQVALPAARRSARPYSPPRLTRNEAEGRTLLAQHVQRRKLVLGDTAWELSMEPLARGAATAFGTGDWLVRAEWGGAPLVLRLPAAAADQWLRARFATLELPQLPASLRTAAFDSALQDVLDALSLAGHGAVRIDSVELAGPAATTATAAATAAVLPDSGHHFGLALASEALTLWATLSTDALGLMLMAGLAAHRPATQGPVARDSIPVLLRAGIGAATLPRAEFAGLGPGDAVLIHHSWSAQDGQIWLCHEGWGLRVRADGAQLVVTAPFQPMEQQMNDDMDDAAGDGLADDETVALDAMPVRLQFDLGQRMLPLAQVTALQVGQVLELTRPLSQAVSIRANGALIGTGELMEIGGRIAVGITSLGRARGDGE